MHAMQAYQQQKSATMSRVDVILTLYDETLRLLESASSLLQHQPNEARNLCQRAALIVGAIAVGIDPASSELSARFLSLYEYVNHCLKEASQARLHGAQKVMRILRDAFLSVRAEAVELERRGEITSLGSARRIQTVA